MNRIDDKILEQFSKTALNALEFEDRYIAGCISNNNRIFKGKEFAGILQLQNERYYQFLITRALLSSFPYYVCNEISSCSGIMDFAFYADDIAKNAIGFGEMKNWMSGSGNKELPGIKNDIQKLQNTNLPGILLIITSNPVGQLTENIGYLENEIPILKQFKKNVETFMTNGWKNKVNDFGLINYLINPNA